MAGVIEADLRQSPVEGGGTLLERLDKQGNPIGQPLIVREVSPVVPPSGQLRWRELAGKVAVDVSVMAMEAQQFVFEHRYQMMMGVVVLGGVSAAVKGLVGLIDAQAINWITSIDPIHLPSLRPALTALWAGDFKMAAAQAALWGNSSLNALADSTLIQSARYTEYSVLNNLHKVTLSPAESTSDCTAVRVFQHDPWEQFSQVQVQGMIGDKAGVIHRISGSSRLPTDNMVCLEPGTDHVIFSADQVGVAEPLTGPTQILSLVAGK